MISFRPLTPADLPLLHEWLQRPHVSEWWSPTPTLAEVAADFLPLTRAESAERGYIALLDGEPLGFIQSYGVMGSGGGWWEDERDPGARGVDQFLAHEAQLGQGLGAAMLLAFTEALFRDPAVSKVQVDPAPDNERAIRCYRRAGFLPQGIVQTPDGPALLMIKRRQD